MKKTYLLLVLMSVSILSGCGNRSIPTITQTSSRTQESEIQMTQYKSKLLSLQYPTDYKVEEKGDMVIVSNTNGKIIIGGFRPSVGHPEADEDQVVFQKISYNKDPKSELDAVPAALYYRNGDTTTENELKTILETVTSTVQKVSKTTQLQTYQNSKYGFEFEYPSDLTVEEGEQGIFFRYQEPILIVKDKTGSSLFTIGTTDYFQLDLTSKNYFLTSHTDVIKLEKNCTASFFGNQNIYAAQMKFGDGFDSSIFYNILMSNNIGLGIETYRTYMTQPGFTDTKWKQEQERINLEQQILKTFHFTGNSKSLNFTCK